MRVALMQLIIEVCKDGSVALLLERVKGCMCELLHFNVLDVGFGQMPV